LDLKVSEFRGRSHKTGVVKRSISLSPNKTKGTAEIGFIGWFNSFDINNWHNSLRKVKNCNKGKSWRKDFWITGWQKKKVHFIDRGCREKCMEKKQ
jgi:hypothetical protein